MRVLIVDDEPDILIFMEQFLKKLKHEPTSVNSGQKAIELLQHERFDFMLSDIMMPDMSGFELHEKLVEIGSPMVDRLAFVAANAADPQLHEMLVRTGRPFLQKPFRLDELRQFLAKILPKG